MFIVSKGVYGGGSKARGLIGLGERGGRASDTRGRREVGREKAAVGDGGLVLVVDGTWCPALDGAQRARAGFFDISVLVCCCAASGRISARNAAKLVCKFD
jgi:hypothetical protein